MVESADDALGFALFLALFSYPTIVYLLTTWYTLPESAVLAIPLALIAGVLFMPAIVFFS